MLNMGHFPQDVIEIGCETINMHYPLEFFVEMNA